MEFKEFLRFADDLIYDKTGKHLNDLQRDILEETLQGHKYHKVAAKRGYKVNYVTEAASDLWKLLSQALGEKITKSNVRTTLERARFSIVSNFSLNTQHNHVTFCEKSSHPEEEPKKTISETPYIDLEDAPTPSQFYGRTQELDILETWIVQKKHRLIAISGMTGSGKTALTVKLIEQIKNNFNYVIWRSLRHFPTAEALQEDLIEVFGEEKNRKNRSKAQQETEEKPVKIKLRILIEFLRQYRCLIILDKVEIIFAKGQLIGEYQPEYQEYGLFFKQLGETNHQSCIILNSWEVPREIQTLAEDCNLVSLLQLEGLGDTAKAILLEKGLEEENTWEELINIYRGNPLWLKWVATMIIELCRGKVSQCWEYEKILIPNDLKIILDQQIQRLSPLEKQILIYLSQTTDPLTLIQILRYLNQSPTDILNAIQSLKKRSLIEKIEVQETQYTLTPLLKEYCLSFLVNSV